jgi:hypothetical protein
MQRDGTAADLNRDREMARVAFVAKIAFADRVERQARGDGDAVISLLAVDRDMRLAEPLQPLVWKLAVAALRLLQAQNIRPVLFEELRDDRHAQPHRIDVPGGDVQPHASAPVVSRLSSGGAARRKPADMAIPAISRNLGERWTAHLPVRRV